MLKQYSSLTGRFIFGLADFEATYRWKHGLAGISRMDEQVVGDSDAKFIQDYLDGALEVAKELGLDSAPPVIQRILRKLASKNYEIHFAQEDLQDLRGRILDQLDSRYFFFVPLTRLDYYQKPELFGSDVVIKFPNAIDDIEEAGKCLALDRGTAAVMHLMRVMECGLKGLALLLGIPYAPSWESYLKQIQAKIGADHQFKDVEWKREEMFFRDVSGDLMTIKQAWRNPTMHVGRKYSAEEAEEIFHSVRTLMQHLATKIPDPLLT
jgi:hypothetical protein